MDLIEFWTLCSSNGIVIEKSQIDLFKRYRDDLKYWNSKINLISRRDEEFLFEHHFLHSLSCLKYIDLKQKAHCLDIGTGGGLPGIPLSIVRNDLKFTLIDSISKKIKTTEMFAKHLNLRYMRTLDLRIEDLNQRRDEQRKYDYIFSRAVATIEKIIGWSDKLIKKSGSYIFYKGGDLETEKKEAMELYPNLIIEEKEIDIVGYNWYKDNEKKIVICRVNNDK